MSILSISKESRSLKNLLTCLKLATWGSRIGKNLQFIANTLEMSPFDGIERTLMMMIMNDDDDECDIKWWCSGFAHMTEVKTRLATGKSAEGLHCFRIWIQTRIKMMIMMMTMMMMTMMTTIMMSMMIEASRGTSLFQTLKFFMTYIIMMTIMLSEKKFIVQEIYCHLEWDHNRHGPASQGNALRPD